LPPVPVESYIILSDKTEYLFVFIFVEGIAMRTSTIILCNSSRAHHAYLDRIAFQKLFSPKGFSRWNIWVGLNLRQKAALVCVIRMKIYNYSAHIIIFYVAPSKCPISTFHSDVKIKCGQYGFIIRHILYPTKDGPSPIRN